MAVSPTRFESREDPQMDYLEGLPDSGVSSVYGLPDPLVLGGLYTTKAHQGLYNPLLEHPDSLLPAKARYLPPLGRGLVEVEEMIGQMEEDIAHRTELVEGPVDVTAHSLGMHIGMAVALRRPELFRSFTGLGGIGCGIESLTPAGHLVKAALRNAAGVEDIMRGSDYMQQHERTVATEWSPDIPVLLVATPWDELATFRDTLGIKLPQGQTAEKRVIATDMPGMRLFLRKVMGMPDDAQILHSKLPAFHELLPRHGVAIEQARHMRGGSVEQAARLAVASTPPRLELVPAIV